MIEYNVFNILRGETPEDVEAEQAYNDFKSSMEKLPPAEQQKVKEEILIQQLMRIEDVVNTYIITCKHIDMGLNNVEDFIQLAKATEKTIAFSDDYKDMHTEIREHLKAYLNAVVELIKASFKSHNL